MAEQYRYTDPTRDIVTRLDTGDSIAVGNTTDPRWQRVQAWMAQGNTIEPPPDTSAQEQVRRLARQALQAVNWQQEVATIAAGRTIVDQIQATLTPGRALVTAIRNDTTGIPNATTRNRLADVLAGMMDNHERAALVLDGSIDKIEMMGGWWFQLVKALAMTDQA